MVFFSEAQLRYAIGQYMAHYHGERNHQDVENQLLRPVERHRGAAAFVRTHADWGACSIFIMPLPPDPLQFLFLDTTPARKRFMYTNVHIKIVSQGVF